MRHFFLSPRGTSGERIEERGFHVKRHLLSPPLSMNPLLFRPCLLNCGTEAVLKSPHCYE
jgi:hypothetical protein